MDGVNKEMESEGESHLRDLIREDLSDKEEMPLLAETAENKLNVEET